MSLVFVILFYASLITLLIGMVKPALFKKKGWIATRKGIAIVCGIFLFIFLILTGYTLGSQSQTKTDSNNATPTATEQNHNTPTDIPTIIPTKAAIVTLKPTEILTPTITPTPTDACGSPSNFIDYEMYQQCEDLDTPAINATVNHDNLGLYITNKDNTKWTSCSVKLDYTGESSDYYQSNFFDLDAGHTTTVSWGDMANNENQRFNYFQTKPYNMVLECTVNGKQYKSTFVF